MSAPTFVAKFRAFLAAPRSRFFDYQIGARVRMTVRTMRAIRQMFSSISAAAILAVRYGIKVFWIDAAPHAAEMVEIEPFWDWSDKDAIGGAMGLVWRFLSSIHPESSIASGVKPRHPNPTASLGNDLNVAKESGFNISKAKLVVSHVTLHGLIGQARVLGDTITAGRFYFIPLRLLNV